MKTNIQSLFIVLHCLASLKWNIDMLTTGSVIDFEANLNIVERIRFHGYPAEVHKIITEDGYILNSYRIPHGLKPSPRQKARTPVIFVHGLGGCPESFLLLGSQMSGPYYLADRGFDVWLFTARGVSFGIGGNETHLKYDWDKDEEYWLYSLHEIGVYDLAGNIDYIVNLTGQPKVAIIGHSAGGNEAYALVSERPEYNEKVKTIISWGSSPILKRLDNPLCLIAASTAEFLKGLMKRFETAEVVPILHSQFRPFFKTLCADPYYKKVCIILTGIIGSHRSYILKDDSLPLMASIIPPRLSSQQLAHFLDNYSMGTFKKFNFGPKKNLEVYGQLDPPFYNLSAVAVPAVFFIANSDSFIQLEDLHDASRQLPNVIEIYKVPYDKFTHFDYIAGKNASDLVYERTYRILRDLDRGRVPPPIKISHEG